MSDKWYKCPKCGSANIEIDDYSEEEEFFFVKKECQRCGFDWYDIYEWLRSEDEMGNVYGIEIDP